MADPTNRSGDTPIAIVGFGHFGRALSELMLNAGVAVRAWDPTAAVPSDIRADSPDDLVAQVEVIVVATPVGEIRSAITTLKPLLSDHQLVLDVGSVKVGPIQAMTDVLGTDVEWVGTHPLSDRPTSPAANDRFVPWSAPTLSTRGQPNGPGTSTNESGARSSNRQKRSTTG